MEHLVWSRVIAVMKDTYYYDFARPRHNAKFWNYTQTKNRSCLTKAEEKNFKLSETAIKLLNKMLHYDPKKRPTISQVLADPWFQEETATVEEVKAFMDHRTQI